MDNIRPHISVGTHPIETGRYILETNTIKGFNKKVIGWIKNRAPGAIVFGRPRLGKTQAIKYISQLLLYEFGIDIPVFHLCCRKYKNPSDNIFFEDFLKDVGHLLSFSGKANVKRERLLKFLIERGQKSGLNKIIIFMDDAQNLLEFHYCWLMDLYNDLDRNGISLTIILVGQEELIHQRSAFILAKKAQIVGRFMVHEYKFQGVKSIDDMRACLISYDNTMYPCDRDWSFTRYFFPDLFADGFRLENCVNDVFNTFLELRNEAKLKKSFEIPMQYMAKSVEYVLINFGANGQNLDRISITQWREAITEIGFIAAEANEDFI
jgi:hypothetical protein